MPTPSGTVDAGAGKAKPQLGQKAGPLPVWGWALIAGGIIFVFIMLTKKSGAGQQAASETGAQNAAPALDTSMLDSYFQQLQGAISGDTRDVIGSALAELEGLLPTQATGAAGGGKNPRHKHGHSGGGVGRGSGSGGNLFGNTDNPGILPGGTGASGLNQYGQTKCMSDIGVGAIDPNTGDCIEPGPGGGPHWKLVCLGGNCSDPNSQRWVPWGPGSPLGFWSTLTDEQTQQYGQVTGGEVPGVPGHHFIIP